MPHRSASAIAARARKLGLTSYARAWSPEEERRLARLLSRRAPVDQVAIALTRTPEAIRQRARRLELAAPDERPRPRQGLRWTADEDQVLRENPGAHPSVMADLLSRSDHSVRRRQRQLGLRSGSRSPHNAPADEDRFAPAEDALLCRELPDANALRAPALLTISARLMRSPAELRRRRAELTERTATPPTRA
jgi:hypothetical protein